MQTLDVQSLGIDRRPLHEEVAERLRTMITEGRLAPGVRLNERLLCEVLRVSRTPLREAFKVLAAERLVELSPNRGARVLALSRSDVEQLFELMGALEGLSGKLAASRRTTAELADIRSMHKAMLAAHARRDLPTYYALNRRIHHAINRCARNAMLSETYDSVNTRIQNLRFRSNFRPEKWDHAVAEHQAMLDALEAGDGEALRGLLEAHLRHKRDAVLEQWPLDGGVHEGEPRSVDNARGADASETSGASS
jgi:DNA-binding GntR family transcriptional regulator